jgi:hypothetical protein
MFKFINNFKENTELKARVNALELENQVLKEKVIKIVLNKFEETDTTKRLRENNKRLRLKNKELKELLNEKGTKR